MDFNLKNDLIFFDLEATGLNVIRDRIMQIAMIKYRADGHAPEEVNMLINPGILISPEAMAVHGITPRDVANKPTFNLVAEELHRFIGDADLAGYNSNRFDIPMLLEEFARVGKPLDMTKRKTIDVQRIFYKMEPRTLKAALKYYTGKELIDAHDALADVRATVDVLKGQLERYENVDFIDGNDEVVPNPVRNDVAALHHFTNDFKTIDATQRLKYNQEGVVVFNFGKYVGQPVGEVLYKDRQYYNWILNKEFSYQVKDLAKQLLKEYQKEQRGA